MRSIVLQPKIKGNKSVDSHLSVSLFNFQSTTRDPYSIKIIVPKREKRIMLNNRLNWSDGK